MKNKTLALFDMDGTLTPARMAATDDVGKSLAKLSNHTKIGIVTGSDFDYLIQQCKSLWDGINATSPTDIFLLPCNGTKLYSWDWDTQQWVLQDSVDMMKHLGGEKFNQLMKTLIMAQFGYSCGEQNLPLTGHFISYRGSMLNWCPIGRNANNEQRNDFIEWDKKNSMRTEVMEELQKIGDNLFGAGELEFALGGNTSIDIYPKGWDKTYALQHFPDHEYWFVGDRCGPTGNDRQIYELLAKENRGFKTTGPEETIEIIEEIIKCLNPTQ